MTLPLCLQPLTLTPVVKQSSGLPFRLPADAPGTENSSFSVCPKNAICRAVFREFSLFDLPLWFEVQGMGFLIVFALLKHLPKTAPWSP